MLYDAVKYVIGKFILLRNVDFTQQVVDWYNAGWRTRAHGIWFFGKRCGILLIKTEPKIKKNVKGRWN